jgi:DNA-binding MarR family transcriptional regulator
LKLHDGVGFQARVVSARANQLFEDLTRQTAITARQYGALLTLHQKSAMTLTELAAEIFVDRSTLTEMVRRLVREGLVSRNGNGEDRRSVVVALTAEGEAAVIRLTPGAAQVQDVLLAPLTQAERRQLLRWMKLIAAEEGGA